MTRLESTHRAHRPMNALPTEEVKAPPTPPSRHPRRWLGWLLVAVGIVGIVGLYFTRDAWRPAARRAFLAALDAPEAPNATTGESAEAHAAHAAPAVASPTALTLSEQGKRNIGLEIATVELRPFERTVTVPAMVAERPGRTEAAISAPMTGTVTKVFALRGAAVGPGDAMFELRMTHEDMVDKQSLLLRDVEQLDVLNKEIARLEEVTQSGAIAGKTLLERKYERQKVEASLRADREALLLHGLSEAQIESIVQNRRLLQTLTVKAPCVACEEPDAHGHDDLYQVTELDAKPGDHVQVGTRLATLADHCELYIEGKAFEQDAQELTKAAQEGRPIVALIDGNGSGKRRVGDLKVLYVEDQVERESRALRFYVRLPNEMIRNEKTPDGRRFISWRYRPGQRVELLVPVERWEKSLVVPVEAVIQEGAENYVYQQAGNRFSRRNVHVQYRDRESAVIESDGGLFPGDQVAGKGAYQIHVALKNKSGGGPDPHAGHNH